MDCLAEFLVYGEDKELAMCIEQSLMEAINRSHYNSKEEKLEL